jgi:hypothetical protein
MDILNLFVDVFVTFVYNACNVNAINAFITSSSIRGYPYETKKDWLTNG